MLRWYEIYASKTEMVKGGGGMMWRSYCMRYFHIVNFTFFAVMHKNLKFCHRYRIRALINVWENAMFLILALETGFDVMNQQLVLVTDTEQNSKTLSQLCLEFSWLYLQYVFKLTSLKILKRQSNWTMFLIQISTGKWLHFLKCQL